MSEETGAPQKDTMPEDGTAERGLRSRRNELGRADTDHWRDTDRPAGKSRERKNAKPSQLEQQIGRRIPQPWQIAGESPSMKTKPEEPVMMMLRAKVAEETWSKRKRYWQGECQVQQIRKPKPLMPIRGDRSQHSTVRRSELAEDRGKERPRRERLSQDEEPTATHGLVWERELTCTRGT